MNVKLALSARDVFKAKIRLGSVASVLRVPPCVRKSIKVFKKGMLSLDFCGQGLDQVWTKSGLSLDLAWTSLRRLRATASVAR